MEQQNQQPIQEKAELKPPIKTKWKLLVIIVVISVLALIVGIWSFTKPLLFVGFIFLSVFIIIFFALRTFLKLTTTRSIIVGVVLFILLFFFTLRILYFIKEKFFPPFADDMPRFTQQQYKMNQSVDQENKTVDWQTYHNEEFGFEVKYPDGWNVTTSFFDKEGLETKAIGFSSPSLIDANKGFGLRTFSNERSFEVERGIEEIKNNPKSYFLSDTVECVEQEIQKVSYLRMTCYAKGDKGIVVSYIVVFSAGIQDLNGEYYKLIHQILSTFRFTPTPKPVSTRVAREITITAKKNQWRFVPEEFEVNQGDRVVLTVVNEDDYDHGIGIDKFGISQRIPANSIIKVEFVTTQAGDFPFYSSVPSGGGIVDGKKRTYYNMVGKIHVRNPIPETK